MKIIKIDKRFKVSDTGYTAAFRFDGFTQEAASIEWWCRGNIGSMDWGYGTTDNQWRGYFGRAPKKNAPRPYYIAFKNEAFISSILLVKDNL